MTGGAVAAFDRDSQQTSVTPAWRDAAFHLVVGHDWQLDADLAQQQADMAKVTAWTQTLREAFPDSGAYWAESDFNEPDWSQSFWGTDNYQRLQKIKQVYDPTGFFVCHHCVELSTTTAAAESDQYLVRDPMPAGRRPCVPDGAAVPAAPLIGERGAAVSNTGAVVTLIGIVALAVFLVWLARRRSRRSPTDDSAQPLLRTPSVY